MDNLEINPICRFCGQVVVTDESFETEAEACEWASRHCECSDAVRYDEIEISKENARKWLLEYDEKPLEIICNMIAAVGFDVIDGVTIKLDSKSISLKKSGSGKIAVKINEKKTEQFDL